MVYERYKEITITEIMKIQTTVVSDLGKMEDPRTLKNIARIKFTKVRKGGTPRHKWWKALQQDMKIKEEVNGKKTGKNGQN